MEKKANVLDWFYILAIVFMTGVAIFVSHIIITKASDSGVFADVPEAQSSVNITKSTILNFDNLMLFVIVGLSIFVLVSSAVVFHHPAMFFISFLLLCIAVIVAAVVSNSFWAFTNNNSIAIYAGSFPKLVFLMSKLPFYVGFMGIAGAVAMFIGYNQQ